MKKILCFTLAFVLLSIYLPAQPKIEKSEKFDEPLSDGYTKLLLLKNGYTFYFHYGGKKGMEVIVFDKKKKKVSNKAIVSNNWNARKKKRVKISGLYEINGEPVVFVEYMGDALPSLYRMRFNPTTGALIKEEAVDAHRKKAYIGWGFARGINQNIYVEKDPESDNYAVIFFNGQAKNRDDRIKMLHFDGNHKLLNTVYYDSPNPNFKYLSYIGAVVDGNKRVYMSTYGSESEKGENAHVYFARMNVGDTTYTNKTLDFTEDFKNTSSDMVFDHSTNTIVMLTNTVATRKKNTTTYASFLSYIDPEDLSLKSVNIVGNQKTNAYAHNTLGIDMDYTGLPQRLVLNSDNSITVLQEEMRFVEVRNSKNNSIVAEYTQMGNIGITEMASDGTEKAGYTLMKHQTHGGHITPFYMAGRQKGIWLNDRFAREYSNDNLFFSYEFIHTPKCDYVLFNDNPKNDKKSEKEAKRKSASNIDVLNTICYTLQDGVATRSYLFGAPESKKKTRACYIDAADYDKRTNTYTTVVSEQHGRKYDSRIAWVHF